MPIAGYVIYGNLMDIEAVSAATPALTPAKGRSLGDYPSAVEADSFTTVTIMILRTVYSVA